MANRRWPTQGGVGEHVRVTLINGVTGAAIKAVVNVVTVIAISMAANTAVEPAKHERQKGQANFRNNFVAAGIAKGLANVMGSDVTAD